MGRHRSGSGPNGATNALDHPCTHAADGEVGPAVAPWVIPVGAGAYRGWLAARDDDLHGLYPVLHDFLTLQGCEGKARKVGSVSLFAEDGKWKAALNDRDGGLVAFCSADSFAGLLEALDRGLKSGSLDWRDSKFRKK